MRYRSAYTFKHKQTKLKAKVKVNQKTEHNATSKGTQSKHKKQTHVQPSNPLSGHNHIEEIQILLSYIDLHTT